MVCGLTVFSSAEHGNQRRPQHQAVDAVPYDRRRAAHERAHEHLRQRVLAQVDPGGCHGHGE